MKKIQWLIVFVLMVGFFASCAFHASEYYFGTYSEAEKLYHQGKYEAAIGKYQQYLNQNAQGNTRAIAEYYIAKSYLMLEKKGEAVAQFEKIMKDYPKTSWADFSKQQLQKLNSPEKK
ncbi:MAG TPA: tetratricopeptide repeat protein [Candidatus Omnitrophota bacterium]|nr:tetratricopeptide repeat protein [Candidatus Omnitrophota bacterium]